MKALKAVLSLALVIVLITGCRKNEMTDAVSNEDLKSGQTPPEGMFTVTIENIMETYSFFESGIFSSSIPPGGSYSLTFHAGPGHKLSFATMYVKSNDLFYGPADTGIDLFDGLFTGEQEETIDITGRLYLWDAGTEINQEPGAGAGQPLNGNAAVEDDPDNTVRIENDMYDYGAVEGNIKVTLWYDGIDEFKLTIENLTGSPTPLAPGVWVIHTGDYPLYHAGMTDFGHGLEALAEDGAPGELGSYLGMHSGYSSPFAPGVWIVHNKNKPLFDPYKADYGHGLEALAEDGNYEPLAQWLNNQDYQSGMFDATGPRGTTTFTIAAKAGDYLSFGTMLVHSNDLFFSPGERGIRLFEGNNPMEGEITRYIGLWDAGTEVNEFPGAGIHQPTRLNGGVEEDGVVMPVDDEFTYPSLKEMIKVTITKN